MDKQQNKFYIFYIPNGSSVNYNDAMETILNGGTNES